ncbi:MAG: hypothetical protein AB7I37_12460 [Pirellulales bacterium]
MRIAPDRMILVEPLDDERNMGDRERTAAPSAMRGAIKRRPRGYPRR